MLINDEYYLVTADNWFLAPDGEEYRAAWGKVKLTEAKEAFGFVPLRPSTNWFCNIGDGENSVMLAGCQIHFAVMCAKRPHQKTEKYIHEVTKCEVVLNKIYFTE